MELKPHGKEVTLSGPARSLFQMQLLNGAAFYVQAAFYGLFPVKCLNDFGNQINFVIIGFPRAYDD